MDFTDETLELILWDNEFQALHNMEQIHKRASKSALWSHQHITWNQAVLCWLANFYWLSKNWHIVLFPIPGKNFPALPFEFTSRFLRFIYFLFRNMEVPSRFKNPLKLLIFFHSSSMKSQTLFPKASNFRIRILSGSWSCFYNIFYKIHVCLYSMQWILKSSFS